MYSLRPFTVGTVEATGGIVELSCVAGAVAGVVCGERVGSVCMS